MKNVNARTIRKALSARVFWGTGEEVFRRVVTDTRVIEEGDLYVALRGPKFDGNDFVGEAYAKGAAGAVVSRITRPSEGKALFQVNDTLEGLVNLGACNRGRFHGPLFAVTGSSGKTTTKDMLARILSGRFRTHSAKKSFNNHVGVSLTLLALEEEHEAAVIEIGTNAPGEVSALAKVVRPGVGIVTTVGRAHLEGFGSLEGVAREKSGMLDGIVEGGTLIVNADNEHTRKMGSRFHGKVVTFGKSKDADYRVSNVRSAARGISFDVSGVKVKVPVLGKHNAMNAAAAIAAAGAAGMGISEASERLARYEPRGMRLEVSRLGGITILNDAYNANPDSMEAAIGTLESYPAKGRRIALLGDMKELGSASASEHRALGEAAAKSKIDVLAAVGPESARTAEAARAAGGKVLVKHFDNGRDAAVYLSRELEYGDVVLAKGSRPMRLEESVELIKALIDGAGRSARRSA